MDLYVVLILAILIVFVSFAGLVSVRSRRSRLEGRKQRGAVEAPERPEAEAEPKPETGEAVAPAPEAPAAEAPPAPPEAPPPPETLPPTTLAPPPAPVEAPPGPPEEAPPKVSRLSKGLAKTRTALGRSLSVLTRADRLGDEDWEDVEAALISADVGVKAASKIVESLQRAKPTPSSLRGALKDELLGILAGTDRELQTGNGSEPAVWLVTGVNGVGKTTSIAKLAYRMKTQGRSVVLAAGDTFRAAAIDQLGTWAERVGVHMVRHAPGADPGAVVYDAIEHARARGVDLVIADTAGRLHTKSNLMEELKKVHRIAAQQAGGVAEVLLVLDATVGQNGIAQARTFGEAVGVTGLILAKLDGSAKGGVAVAVEQELGIPVKAVGVGEGLDDLAPFDPQEFVEALIDGR